VVKRQRSQSGLNREPAFLPPSIEALIIQVFSLFVVFLGAQTAINLVKFSMPVAGYVVIHGAFASLLARWRGLATWWIGIQFAFPILVFTTQRLHLPSWLFLTAFLFSVALYWTTFRTQVPFFPSGENVWKAVADILPGDDPIRFVDVGSGFGGLILYFSRRRPHGEFIGVEIAPLPWFSSVLRAFMTGSRGRFFRKDYRAIDFAAHDVVFAYLSPAAMPELWKKASTEMRSGTLLLSYEFPVPDVEPHIVSLPDTRGASLYGWHM
jgi:hypothetical protein